MEQGTPTSKWVNDVLEYWDKKLSDFSVSKSIEKALRSSCRANLDTLGKINPDKFSGWQAEWIKWNIETMREIINSSSDEAESEEEEPEWLKKIEIEFVKAEMPTLNFRALKHKSPIFSDAMTLGQVVGHEFAAWHPDSPGMAAAIEKIEPENRMFLEAFFAYMRPKRMKYVRKIISTASKQSFKDVRSFFRGFSMAI